MTEIQTYILRLTENMSNKVDVLQRIFPRFILNVKRLEKKNVDVYQKCQTYPWSETMKIRSLKFLEYLLRLDLQTPARKALEKCFKLTLRDPGRPVTI